MNKKKIDELRKMSMPENRRPLGAWLIILLMGAFIVSMYVNSTPKEVLKDLSPAEFKTCIESGVVEEVVRVREVDTGITYLQGTFTDEAVKRAQKDIEAAKASKKQQDGAMQQAIPDGTVAAAKRFRVKLVPGENEAINNIMMAYGVKCPLKEETNIFGPILKELLVFALLIGATWFLFFRKIGSGGIGGPFGVGKSRAKLLTEDRKKTTFGDVAGVDEAKEEVQEIIEFLKAPDKFKKLGGRIPKGVLLVGPPGTGKTLLARAIAGEAGVPFFSISGSDFMEMFVGVGASRVRDMFEQGKKSAPCIIFIDEIDAVGQKRSRMSGGYGGGGYSEQEQTLNAMLVEMDGFDANEGVIIVAATNRPDVLDPALLRPGRFDRQIMVDLPTLKGREQILALHGSKIKFAPDADLGRIARGTPGFSGADLANLLNEAALLAARNNLDGVTHQMLEEARDKVLWGRERRSAGYTKRDREITAWHESGHALMQLLLKHTDPLHKVTIIPRGRSLGATMTLPDHDVLNKTKSQFIDELAVFAGGRVAEKMFTGEISTGAAQDIAEATKLARAMVCKFGMAGDFGFQTFLEQSKFVAEDTPPPFSPATCEAIDREVRRLVDEAYSTAENLLSENKDKLELLAKTLLEKESMDGRDIEDLLGFERRSESSGDESGEQSAQ